MKEGLPIHKRIVNAFSEEYCETTGERLTVEHGWQGEGRPTCESCPLNEECYQTQERLEFVREMLAEEVKDND